MSRLSVMEESGDLLPAAGLVVECRRKGKCLQVCMQAASLVERVAVPSQAVSAVPSVLEKGSLNVCFSDEPHKARKLVTVRAQ